MRAYVAELVGTALLVLLGDGAVAGVLLSKSKAQNSGWIVITTGWALAVAIPVYAVGRISGAHINPAITLALAVVGKFPWTLVPGYIAAQMLGAFIGAGAGVAGLSGPLARDPGRFAQADDFFNRARDSPLAAESAHRDDRNLRAGFWRDGPGLVPAGQYIRLDAAPGRLSRLGDWTFARRSDRLRDQSGPRLGSANRPLAFAHRWQRRVRLGLRLGSGRRAACRRRGGRARVYRTVRKVTRSRA